MNKVIIIIILIAIIITATGIFICTNEHFKNKINVKRPHHPKWYKDIDENHPEVLSLIKQTAEQSKKVKKYTSKGWTKMKMPVDVYEYLLDVVKTTDRIKEDKNNIFPRTSSGLPPYIISLPSDKKLWVHKSVQKTLEDWSGIALTPTSAYGPREYRRGSSLRMHCDREETHIISAIFHIWRENMDKDWPLVIINRQGKREEIYMEPGEMVLYESASLPHSREKPLMGDYYVNMFIHFAPA